MNRRHLFEALRVIMFLQPSLCFAASGHRPKTLAQQARTINRLSLRIPAILPTRQSLLSCRAMIRMLIVLPILFATLAQAPKRPPRPGVRTLGVRVPMNALKPDAVFEVPGAPDWIAIDESVWVSNYPKNTVARLDPKSNKVIAMIEVGSKPCSGLAVGFGSLWVPLCGDQGLARVDLKEGKVTAKIPIGIGDSEGGLAAGADSIWLITDKKGTLARIDPAT